MATTISIVLRTSKGLLMIPYSTKDDLHWFNIDNVAIYDISFSSGKGA